MDLVGINEPTGWSYTHGTPDRVVDDSFFGNSISDITPIKPHTTHMAMCCVAGAYGDVPTGIATSPAGHNETSSDSSLPSGSPEQLLQSQLIYAQCSQREAEARAVVESRKTEVARIQLQLVSTRDTSGSSRSRSRTDHNIKPTPKSPANSPLGDILGMLDSPVATMRG